MRSARPALHLVPPAEQPAQEPAQEPEKLLPHLEPRGYRIAYQGAQTQCPSCHRSNWWVGKGSAQCAFCETVVPFLHPRQEQ
jgi:hypothetical protein